MKNERIFNAVGKISDELIEDAAITTKKKTHTVVWVRWAAMAACLCLVLGFLPVYNFWISSEPQVIYGYNGKTTSSYTKTPSPGEYYCYIDVSEARQYYQGQNVEYLLAIDLFADSEITASEMDAEYQRLAGLGYRLYESECWTYSENGEREYHTVVVGVFSEKELVNFKVNTHYGYVFRFVTNGDGTHIVVDTDKMITNYGMVN